MKELLLEKNLRKAKPEDEVRAVARTLTIATMRRSDGNRNEILWRFLDEVGIINKSDAIIHFEGANLSKVELKEAFLPVFVLNFAVDLGGAKLTEANLTWAKLCGTKLSEDKPYIPLGLITTNTSIFSRIPDKSCSIPFGLSISLAGSYIKQMSSSQSGYSAYLSISTINWSAI